MHGIFSFFIRLALVAAGLVFAASLVLVAAVLLALWGVRALWCKLTGRPMVPFALRVDPRGGFERVFRARTGAQADAGAPSPAHRRMDDVTDVEAKDLHRTPR